MDGCLLYDDNGLEEKPSISLSQARTISERLIEPSAPLSTKLPPPSIFYHSSPHSLHHPLLLSPPSPSERWHTHATHTHTHTSSLSPSSIYQSGSWAMLYWCCRRSWTSLTYMLGWHTLRGITRMHTHSGHHAQPCDTWDTTHAQTDERVVVVGWGWGIPAHVNTDVTTDMHSDITPWHVHRFLTHTHTQSLS